MLAFLNKSSTYGLFNGPKPVPTCTAPGMETITHFFQGLVCLETFLRSAEICVVSEVKELSALQISLQQSSTLLTYNTEEKLFKSPYLLEEVYLSQAFIDHRNSLLRPVFSASRLLYSWDVSYLFSFQSILAYSLRGYRPLWKSASGRRRQSVTLYLHQETDWSWHSVCLLFLPFHSSWDPSLVCCSQPE